MSEPVLVIRVDANVAIGTGHVMRCLALAQAWQDGGGKAVFAMGQTSSPLCERLRAEGMEVVVLENAPGSCADARSVARLTEERRAEWVVVDGYHFDADYQRELKAAGLRVLFMDDNGHASHYAADLILNQNAYADESFYPSREAYTRLLLGSRYVLLRREFQAWRNWKRVLPPVARKLLVCMGGSDSGNVTATVIPSLRSIPVENLEVVIVAGGSNPHLKSLEAAVGPSGGGFRLVNDVVDMPERMAWADVMLAAAGTIAWEICAMALPALLLVTAANQARAAQHLVALGAALTCDSDVEKITTAVPSILLSVINSQTSRQNLSSKARRLVDLEGSARVASILRGVSDPIMS